MKETGLASVTGIGETVSQRPEGIYESRVSRIPGVLAIITWREERMVHMWTVMNELDESIAEQIYEVEAVLQENFDEKFDFYVGAGDVQKIKGTISPEAQVRFLPVTRNP